MSRTEARRTRSFNSQLGSRSNRALGFTIVEGTYNGLVAEADRVQELVEVGGVRTNFRKSRLDAQEALGLPALALGR